MAKNSIFNCIKLSNMQKNRANMHCFCIITRFWCGRKERSDGIARDERPGIEDIRRYEKALIFKAFLLLNANVDAKIFWGRYDIAGLI